MDKKLERQLDRNMWIGKILYYLGVHPGATHDIGDSLSLGYGELDDNGFWQYPIPYRPLPHLRCYTRKSYSSIYRSLFTLIIEWSSPYDKIFFKNKWIEDVVYARQLFEFPKIKARSIIVEGRAIFSCYLCRHSCQNGMGKKFTAYSCVHPKANYPAIINPKKKIITADIPGWCPVHRGEAY